jgi:hypothetical protein
MMAGGLAIVAICPAWSDLSRLVRESQCGIVINNSPFETVEQLERGDYLENCYAKRSPNDISAEFKTAVMHLLDHRDLLEQMRHNAREAAHTRYGSAALRARWAGVISRAE